MHQSGHTCGRMTHLREAVEPRGAHRNTISSASIGTDMTSTFASAASRNAMPPSALATETFEIIWTLLSVPGEPPLRGCRRNKKLVLRHGQCPNKLRMESTPRSLRQSTNYGNQDTYQEMFLLCGPGQLVTKYYPRRLIHRTSRDQARMTLEGTLMSGKCAVSTYSCRGSC